MTWMSVMFVIAVMFVMSVVVCSRNIETACLHFFSSSLYSGFIVTFILPYLFIYPFLYSFIYSGVMWAQCGLYQGLAYVDIDGHPVSFRKNLVLRFLTVLVLGVSAKIAKKVNISLVMSVRPYGIIRLQLDGFSWNLIFEYFSKICRINSSVFKP